MTSISLDFYHCPGLQYRPEREGNNTSSARVSQATYQNQSSLDMLLLLNIKGTRKMSTQASDKDPQRVRALMFGVVIVYLGSCSNVRSDQPAPVKTEPTRIESAKIEPKSTVWGTTCQFYMETVANDCDSYGKDGLWPQICPVFLEGLQTMQSSLPLQGTTRKNFDAVELRCDEGLKQFNNITKSYQDFPRTREAVKSLRIAPPSPLQASSLPDDEVELIVPIHAITIWKTMVVEKPPRPK